MTGRSLQLTGVRTCHTLLRLLRAGNGLTVITALAGLALLLLLHTVDSALVPRIGPAALALALLAATVCALAVTTLVAADGQRPGWEQYLGTLPGQGGNRTVGFLFAGSLVGLPAALPVAVLGAIQGPDDATVRWLLLLPLIPAATVPGVLLGLLLARVPSRTGRRLGVVLALAVLALGSLTAIGLRLPGWAAWLGSLAPTFPADLALTPILTGGPVPYGSVLVWALWCAVPLLILFVLDHRPGSHR